MADLIEYKCPSCGGKLEFSPGAQQMQCPFCDSALDVAALQSFDEVLNQAQPDQGAFQADTGDTWEQGEAEGMRIYKCQSCGGEIMADETTAASNCPYCDNPVIMTGQLSGDLKPELVIPFKFDKEAAKKALRSHMEGKRLLPKVFKDENHIDEIKGVYVPVWLFEADSDSQMVFKAHKSRTWSDNMYNYREIKYFSAVRAGTMSFANLPVDGSTKMDDTLMESLEPFQIGEATEFQTAYLSGYLADKYDVDAEASMPRAEERMKQSIRDAFVQTLREYDGYDREQEHINLQSGRVKYALYPVWMLNTSWNGERYTFAMNGQSGKFVGNLPSDKGKAVGSFALVSIISMVVAYLIAMMITQVTATVILVCIIIGLIIGGISVGSMLSQLKSVTPKREAADYIREKLQVSRKQDIYLYNRIEKTPRAQQQQQPPRK